MIVRGTIVAELNVNVVLWLKTVFGSVGQAVMAKSRILNNTYVDQSILETSFTIYAYCFQLKKLA